jgi:integrase
MHSPTRWSVYGAAALVGAWCFLRPSELLGLERRDVDTDAGLLHVRGTKTARSQRSVPVPLRARHALADLPARVDTRLVFPAPAGGRYALERVYHHLLVSSAETARARMDRFANNAADVATGERR